MKNIFLAISLLFATTSHAAFFGIEGQILRDTALIQNGGFENGDSQWTESGSSVFTRTTSGVNWSGIGSASGGWDATAASETLTSDQASLPNGLLNSRCLLSFIYKGGDSNLIAKVIDGALADVASLPLTAAAAWSNQSIEFSCPSSGTVAVQIVSSADAAIIYLDKIFLGEAPDRGVATNPIRYDKTRSIGTVGSVANDKGPLVDGDFTTIATSAYYSFNNDASKSGGGSGDAVITKHDTTDPVFTKKGFFGNENILTFTSSNDDRLSSSNSFYNPGDSTDWTVSFYAKFDKWDLSDNRYMAANWSSTSSADVGWYIANVGTNGAIEYSVGVGASGPTIASIPSSGLDGWHHFAISYDSSANESYAYFDGTLLGSASGIADPSTADLLLLGGLNDASDTFDCDCSMAEFSFEHRKLSDAEVNERYSKRFSNHHQIEAGHVLTNDSFPFTDFDDKYAFWNLTDINDGSGATGCVGGSAQCQLTNNGGIVFDALDIFGQPGIARLDGVNDSFSSTDAYFNKGGEVTLGGWFSLDDWTPSSVQHLFNNNPDGSDVSLQVEAQTDGTFRILVTNTNAVWDSIVVTQEHGFIDGSKHHILVRFRNGVGAELYVDGLFFNVAPNDNRRKTTVNGFNIGVSPTGTGFLAGSIEKLSYAPSALSDEDIKKLYSAKITTGIQVATENQSWNKSRWGREDGQINNELGSAWLLDQNSTDIYLNTGLPSGSEISLKMEDNSFSVQTVASSTYASGELSAAPTFPINHNLPSKPKHLVVRTEGQVSAGTWEERHDLCDATDTQINCDLSGLTIDGTHKVEIIASMTPSGTAVDTASPTELGLVRSVTPDIVVATSSVAGLYDAGNVDGVTDGVAIGSGKVGEVIRTSVMSNTVLALTATDVIGSSITLTPGIWHIFYNTDSEVVTGGAASDRSLINLAVYTSANVLVDETESRHGVKATGAVATASNGMLSGSAIVNISSSTTYKLRGSKSDVAGVGVVQTIATANQGFYAVRIQ